MVLIFLRISIVFNVFNFKFYQVKSPLTSSTIVSGHQFIRPQSTELSGLWEMLESYYKLQSKLNTVPKFTDAR